MYRYIMFMDKNNLLKIHQFFLNLCTVLKIPIKISTRIFIAFNNMILKCVWKNKKQELSVIWRAGMRDLSFQISRFNIKL